MDKINKLNESQKEELNSRLKALWTYNSNAIEGNNLTLEETSLIIENEKLVNIKNQKGEVDDNSTL